MVSSGFVMCAVHDLLFWLGGEGYTNEHITWSVSPKGLQGADSKLKLPLLQKVAVQTPLRLLRGVSFSGTAALAVMGREHFCIPVFQQG